MAATRRGDPDDYSCYITIRNNTDVDFLLGDFCVEDWYGVWPLYQPLNTIEKRTAARVHLRSSQVGSSEGWVLYEVNVGDKVEKFHLRFAIPCDCLRDNYLEQWSSDSNRLRVDVKPFKPFGHPFYGEVKVSIHPQASAEANPSPRPWYHAVKHNPQDRTNNDVHTGFDLGFDYPGPGQKHPIHENITIAAFTRSRLTFPKALTYKNINRKQWEYFRGLIWNDDPSCLLFGGSEDNNRGFASGNDWYEEFRFGSSKSITWRSHFGDLRFLHSMGAAPGEDPHDTQGRILAWMGVMYKLACGGQGVTELDSLKEHFPLYFDGSSDPPNTARLKDLILATTPEHPTSNIRRRALGICLHMIQDSYAVSHVQRRLLNPQDVVAEGGYEKYVRFKPGTWGQWGRIISFHTYGSQDEDRYSFNGGLEGAGVPNPRNLNSFNHVNGARDAIEACLLLINAFAAKRDWRSLRRSLKHQVFCIDAHAKPCNSNANVVPGLETAAISGQQTMGDDGNKASLLAKMPSLESGIPEAPTKADYEADPLAKMSSLESGLREAPTKAEWYLSAWLQYGVAACVVVLLLICVSVSCLRNPPV